MHQPFIKKSKFILGLALLATASLTTSNREAAWAQSFYPHCQQPNSGKFLLFMVSQTPETLAIKPPTVVQTVATPPAENNPAYHPRPLGRGYAVLVDYFNQPEIANQLRRVLGKEVGLVSYAQRPYLLALRTTEEANARRIFRLLNERGFYAILVDSRKVTLLRSRVQNP